MNHYRVTIGEKMRKNPRAPVKLPITLNGWGVSFSGLVTDLSANGLFVALKNPAKISPIVTCQVPLVSQPEPLELLGRVVRSTKSGIGAEFIELNPEKQLLLRENLLGLFPERFDACPYCGNASIKKNHKYCQRCQHPLDLNGPSADLAWEQGEDFYKPPGMIGACPEMQAIFGMIQKLAAAEVPVLITGPSGTGKEMVARAIHQRSNRQGGPFVAINCGGFSRDLIEAELFGHEKGSFTGAYRNNIGTLERAQGGTLFLDEVGELPLDIQVKLLRFLQDYTFERVGGRETIKVDVRVIAATNAPLQEMIADGRFREDLYYRLDVVNIEMPPLKDRGDDILILANVLARKYAKENGKEIKGFSEEIPVFLKSYHWPGNIRELINCIIRAVVIADSSWIKPEHLGVAYLRSDENNLNGSSGISNNYSGMGLKEAKAEFERNLLQETLKRCQGNALAAAKVLKISRSVIYSMISKHDLKIL